MNGYQVSFLLQGPREVLVRLDQMASLEKKVNLALWERPELKEKQDQLDQVDPPGLKEILGWEVYKGTLASLEKKGRQDLLGPPGKGEMKDSLGFLGFKVRLEQTARQERKERPESEGVSNPVTFKQCIHRVCYVLTKLNIVMRSSNVPLSTSLFKSAKQRLVMLT